MIQQNNLDKLKGYIGLANRAGYVIFGADNLKIYTHKMYLVLHREDGGKTIEKTLNKIKEEKNIDIFCLSEQDFNYIVGKDNCKLLAIKNKGLSDQIIKILRSEQIG